VAQVRTFIDTALSKQPVNERELIAKKVDDFVKGLKANKAVYEHISKFLSNNCTASNAEYAISELLEKASRSVLQDIDRTFTSDPVEGMNAAVAWNIENSMRSKSGAIKIILDSINPNDKGGFDVVFNVNDKLVKSEWIKEYGVYRMDTYGDLSAGGKNLLDEKEKKKAQDKALRTDYDFAISAGYANVFDYGSALHAAVRVSSPFTYGLDLFYGLSDKEYLQFGANIGHVFPIRLNTFGLIPFGEVGMVYISSKESKREDRYSDIGFGFAIGPTLKGGLMFTSAKVSGLFGRLYYEHTLIFLKDKNDSFQSHGIIGVSIGYGF
jgi:hypothetical protein